jgi:CHAT domain-containing protein
MDNFVRNQNPLMRSGLVFAGVNDFWSGAKSVKDDDGVLTALEVINIDLRQTQLVVMSACETGLGDIAGSEGVYGLQRAFKMAGTNFLIMSLWQVPDKETSEFMQTFYTLLLENRDLQKAFSETQAEMRQKYNPFFWAAFVLLE